jgi:hypothetical protein
MNRRNLSGIYLFHKFEDEENRKPTCFEDLPIERQKEWLSNLNEEALKNLVIALSKTIRRLGDEFGIITTE